jgi:hypothetical protein
MNVTILATSTAFGQGIVLLAPILTRLYLPGDFGVMAAYASIILILSVIAALRYDFVIPLLESDEESVNVVAGAFVSLFIMTVVTTVGIIVFGSTISTWLQTPSLMSYLWLLPIGIGEPCKSRMIAKKTVQYRADEMARAPIGVQVASQHLLGTLQLWIVSHY